MGGSTGVMPLLAALFLQASTEPGSLAGDVLRTVVALIAVCLLAWISLKLLASRKLVVGGFRGERGAPVEVLQRVVLESRQRLYVVRAGKRKLLLGVGDGGPPRLITELNAEVGAPAAAGDGTRDASAGDEGSGDA